MKVSCVHICYSENNEQINKLLKFYNSIEIINKNEFEIIIIDDHSPNLLFIENRYKYSIYIYRIVEDVVWNLSGARNIGVKVANGKNILLSDSDHYFSNEILNKFILEEIPEDTVYTFNRIGLIKEIPENRKNSISKSIIGISKNNFMKIGGYDEQFSGGYGFEEYAFFDELKNQNIKVVHLNLNVFCDVGTTHHTLKRDLSRNNKIYKSYVRSNDNFKNSYYLSDHSIDLGEINDC